MKVGELGSFNPSQIGDLKGQVRRESHAKTVRWPDWDRHPATDAWADQLSGLWGSSAFLWFFAFAVVLGSEWGLRRMWGMVLLNPRTSKKNSPGERVNPGRPG